MTAKLSTFSTTAPCPCASQKPYGDCCEPIHLEHSKADHPEKLMRARYSAHVVGLVDFVVDTYHTSCHAEAHRDAIASSVKSKWQMLQVLSSSVDDSGRQGFVEFKAHYVENGTPYCLHEKSRFVAEDRDGESYWYYIDGEYPKADKVGRNDPCPCGSGKKHKKCCG
ncbi:SEC-C domain-containing protein [Enterovibrio sp. ZSDZ42]|uniref:SEC-C domain-containing protein n=1 Tax=Enterovibrio gelatinilyticus TaxID=2899819 RepID=A0ABT5QXY5_9GAMM|nr:YchJ family metal-binding protein [Enterovibrio sp. ZSDZ42]MDD1792876.1 SEC-C domain-containing protein [Enterovibrio sp. ZSDZ42]